jgi:competence protein ComFC
MINCTLLSELIFPTRCAGCGIYCGRPLCPQCNSALPRINGPVCRRCGKPSLYEVDECLDCRGRIRHIERTVALGVYEEPLRSAIHKLKYGNGWRLARPLGAMAAVHLAPKLRSPHPLVTFVPMHRRKRRARGYDHAEKLAEGLAAGLGLSAVRMLERTRATKAQANLALGARRSNVKGVFDLAGQAPAGEEIVLVDDVLTTGYTLSECAKVLKSAGASSIVACVLARDLLTEVPRATPSGR